jgi:hypothetical protein
VAGPRIELDVATVAACDPARDVQTEPGSLPYRLGREKRIEHARLELL